MPKPFRIGFFSLGAALLLQAVPTPSKSAPPLDLSPERAYIAIIIDDIGHNRLRGENAIRIAGNLTYSVIPDAHHATSLARLAHTEGKEVMVHLPMENLDDRPIEKLALTSALKESEINSVLDLALRTVPHAKGLNNHMGSALTEQVQPMNWLMQAIKRHHLFFVDSRTTPRTVASKIAEQQNVMNSSRDVFLDNEANLYSIDQQFRKLMDLARKQKTAIAIGHPYPATIDYLSRAIPQLEDERISVVPASSILMMRLAERQIASRQDASGAE